MSNLKNDLPSHSDASCLFEGMTSINAIIHAIESGTNDRQILRIFFDRDKTTSKSRELAFLRKESEKLGFHIEFTNSTVIDKKNNRYHTRRHRRRMYPARVSRIGCHLCPSGRFLCFFGRN